MADFVDNTGTVLSELDSAIERALEKIGLTAEAYAKLLCPVNTGRLRNSITHATSTGHNAGEPPAEPEDYELHGNPEKGSVYIGTNVEYAQAVEMGSSKRRAHPYLRPAAENHTSEYQRIMESELRGR